MRQHTQIKLMAAAILAIGAAKAMAEGEPVAPERRIVVSIPDRKLALVENGRAVKVYSVAVGADVSPSPTGSYRVVNRLKHPTYYKPGTVVPAGAANPLGSRWMGLDRKSYGIHGTNQPKSIGKAASHGCIRMARKDLEELFELVRVGDAVEIHGERDGSVAAVFGGAEVATAAATETDDMNNF